MLNFFPLTPTSRQSGSGARAIPRTTPAAPETASPVRELPLELEDEEEDVGDGAAVAMRGRLRIRTRCHMVAPACNDHTTATVRSSDLDFGPDF